MNPEPPGSPGTDEIPPVVVAVLRAVLDTLEESELGRLTIALAKFCSFLSPEGVSLRLLRSRSVIGQLPVEQQDADSLALDAGEMDRVLWMGVRYGLFDVDWGQQPTLVMHRAFQTAIADVILTGEARQACRRRVLAALAAFAPTEIDPRLLGNRAKFAELQRHLLSSGALTCTDSDVRRWLVNHARFIFLEGDIPAMLYAATIVERLIELWRGTFRADDILLTRLTGQLANIYRALGRNADALALDDAVLLTQRKSIGLKHRRTLITTRGRGGDLRGLGRFGEAYDEDNVVWEQFREMLGDDHPETRMAANNLATSAFLIGDVPRALQLERDNFDRRMRLFGPDDPDTWFSSMRIGVYQRELGGYGAAARRLEDARAEMRRLGLPDNHPHVLATQWNLAIARRRRSAREKQPNARPKDMDDITVKAYRTLLGEEHPYTLGSSLSLAADHHSLGNSDVAVVLAQRCLAGYQSASADHPFTSICRLNLALYLRAVGQTAAARESSATALGALRARLGNAHPWTLIASVNHACLLASVGELREALDLAVPNQLLCQETLGNNHPYTVESRTNVDLMRNVAQAGDGNGRGQRDEWGGMDVDVPQT